MCEPKFSDKNSPARPAEYNLVPPYTIAILDYTKVAIKNIRNEWRYVDNNKLVALEAFDETTSYVAPEFSLDTGSRSRVNRYARVQGYGPRRLQD